MARSRTRGRQLDARRQTGLSLRVRFVQADRAFPVDLPEWRHVNVKANIWAVRHYRARDARNDPTSPLRPKASANVPDGRAVGFVFWLDGNTAKARYLTDSTHGVEIISERWRLLSDGFAPEISEVQKGVVEIAVAIPNGDVGFDFLFVLMGYLGHAVYV